jgi:hemolysin activation/secretion protein
MIKQINWLQSYAVLGFLTYSLAGAAADINQIDTTAQEQIRQQERLNQLRQQQEIKPDARGAGESLKTTVPVTTDVIPDNETPCFTITKIELVGDTAKHFKFALNEVLHSSQSPPSKPILGRCLGAVGINAIMTRVQNAIIAKGY